MNYQFELHEADVDSLSQCNADIISLREWLEGLPLANVGESARQVYVAAQEVAALDIEPASRLDMLDALRDTVYYLCESLSKHYLNQPPLLSDKQFKVASLCSALQTTLANGYILCAVQLEKHGHSTERGRYIARAVHRGISDLSRTLLRSFQIYGNAPQHLWLHANQLYCMAGDLQVTAHEIDEPQNRQVKQTSVQAAYKRLLLMGCSRPSQIRQSMLQIIYDASEGWVDLTRIHPKPKDDDLFGINLSADLPPRYLSDCDLESGDWRSFSPEPLAEALASHVESTCEGSAVKARIDLVPPAMALHVVDHLIATWSVKADRMEQRRPADEPVQVCVGLTAVQYFLSGQVDFGVQMSGGVTVSLSVGETNPFLNQDRARLSRTMVNQESDGWSKATDAGHGGFGDIDVTKLEMILGASAVRKYKQEGINKIADLADQVPTQPLHHPRMINRSPGGCCLQWEEGASDRLQDGQLIGLREAGDAPWRLGMACWIRRNGEQQLQTGVRFVANNGIACGAAIAHKERDRIEFMRAIELPELASSGELATLILPNVPFKPDIKIFLNRLGKTSKAVLGKAQMVTSSFSRFEFRELDLDASPEKPAVGSGKKAPVAKQQDEKASSPDDPFGNLWKEL